MTARRNSPELAATLAELVEVETARVRQLEARAMERAPYDLAAFARLMWPAVEPSRPLVWSRHMSAICREASAHRYQETHRDCVVNIPPRHSKSSLIGVMLPAWIWLTQPSAQVLCVTKAENNALRDARGMRRVIEHPTYRAMVRARSEATGAPEWRMSDDQDRVQYYANTQGGHRISLTTASNITGSGADYLIIDDPYDAEEVAVGSGERQVRIMEEVRDKLEEVWVPRLNPPTPKLYLVMQRLHDLDLSRYLLARGARSVVLPMRYEADHPHRYAGDWRTVDGELLAPERFPPGMVAALEGNALRWSGQYQQRPVPREGGLFRAEWLARTYPGEPRDYPADYRVVTVDASFKGSATADYCAIQVWAMRGQTMALLHAIRARLDYPGLRARLREVVPAWRPALVLVEDKANGPALISELRGEIAGLVPWTPEASKEARAQVLAGRMEAGDVLFPEPGRCGWWEPYRAELLSFPRAAHDDQVDASSMMAVYSGRFGASLGASTA